MVSDHATRVDLMRQNLKSLMKDLNKKNGKRPKVQVRFFDVSVFECASAIVIVHPHQSFSVPV